MEIERASWYVKWHRKPHHVYVHWSVFLFTILLTSQFLILESIKTLNTHAQATTGATNPTLPLTYVDTTYPVLSSNRTIYRVDNACSGIPNCFTNLQTAIDTAQLGDEIAMTAGQTFTGNFFLRNKTSGNGWIIIRTTDMASLPPAGNRVSPSDASAMAKIVSPGSNVSAIEVDYYAHHYRLVGLEVTEPPGNDDANVLIQLGSGFSYCPTNPNDLYRICDPSVLSMYPHHLVLDRMYIHGQPAYNVKRGVGMDSKDAAVIDSYISDIHVEGQDAQAIAGAWGPGPYKIVNNYLSGSGENVIFGGDDPRVTNLIPTDIEIRNNYFFKPLSWQSGRHWAVKNLFELKSAKRVLIDGNIFENNWIDGQNGIAVLFTSKNQGGNCPWCAVTDVTFTNNIIDNSPGALNILGTDYLFPSGQTQRVRIYNNWIKNISGLFMQVLDGATDIIVDHNTSLQGGNIITVDGAPTTNFIFQNNITPHNTYGIIGNGTAPGISTINSFFPGSQFNKNVLVGANSSAYPTNNFYPCCQSSVGYINYPSNISLASSSPYKNAATDGTDIGVNMNLLNIATANTKTGTGGTPPSPPPPPPPPPPTPPTSNLPPNIVVIMTDDQDDGGTLNIMTNVKSQLLNKGVRFTNSFAVNPLCCPSRATFLTGQYNHNNNIWTNFFGGYDGRVGGYGTLAPTANNTLPVWLQSSGYYTGLIGKYLNGYGIDVPPTNVPPGWNTWIAAVDPTNHSYYNYTLNENGTLRTYGSSVQDYQTDVISQKAVSFINAQANSQQPFFLWLTPLAPHDALNFKAPEPAPRHKGLFSNLQLPQPPSFNESDLSDKPQFMQNHVPLMDSSLIGLTADSYRKRREALLGVDEMVGNVINALQTTGKLNNTYIIFTSDNGYFNGEHRLPFQKYLAYEESIRIPLIIRGPGIPVGETRNQLVGNVDLPATILELSQSIAGRIQDGKSIMPLVSNSVSPGRTTLLLEGMNKVPNDNTFYGYYSAVRTDRFVYIEHILPGGVAKENEFYDLFVDPYELQSKPNDPAYASVTNDLQGKLNILKTCIGATCWMTDSIPPPPTPPPSSSCNISSVSWQPTQVSVGTTATMTVSVSDPLACSGQSIIVNIYEEDPLNPDDLLTTLNRVFNQTGNQMTLTYQFTYQDYINGGNESGNESIYFTAQLQGQSNYIQSGQINFYNVSPSPTPSPTGSGSPSPSPSTTPTPTPSTSSGPTPSITVTPPISNPPPAPPPGPPTPPNPSAQGKNSSIPWKLVNPLNSFGNNPQPQDIFGVILLTSNWILNIAQSILVILILYSGLRFMISRGNPGEVQKAKSILKWALIGFAIILIGKGFVFLVESVLRGNMPTIP